jgi:hypothetical protein
MAAGRSVRLRRRVLVLTLAGLAAALLHAPSGAAKTFFVGLDEDALLSGDARQASSVARTLGVGAVRVTVRWHPGESMLPSHYQRLLDRTLVESWGLRVVVSVFGAAADAPRTDTARTQYCDFVADLLRHNPTIRDVVVWNDPNDGAFWSPQLASNGTSVAPADYGRLLARCWDTLHKARPGVNVVALTVSRTGSRATGHTTAAWYRKLGAAYRASGRLRPLFDTVGHIPHPEGSAERPWIRHGSAGPIGQGDYDVLVKTLGKAFGWTGQPLPGNPPVSIWYLAQGFQTNPDPAKAALYVGNESDASPLAAWSEAAASDDRQGAAPDQATQLADAIALAYCQPKVGAFFTFQLVDEPRLEGWQSGVLWADWTPKPSYVALRRLLAQIKAGSFDCSSFTATGVPPRPAPTPPPGPALQISHLRVTSLSAMSAEVAWRTSVPSARRVAYGLTDGGPTVWAAAGGSPVEHQARLYGLSSGTAYRITVDAFTEDGQRAQAQLELATPGLPGSVRASVQWPSATLLVDGEPFFPLMVWSQCPDGYGASLAAGINLFAENPCGGLQAQLDALGGRALSAGVAGKDGGSGAGLVGFFYPDEADAFGFTGESLPPPPLGVPTQPSFLTLTNHFYSAAAPLPQGRSMYPGLIAKSDVVGFDLFPLQEWCKPDRLDDVYHAQQELVRLAAGKPTFQWIEAAEWRCPGGKTAVTPATVRAESWLAIAGGARGLGFFPGYWSPTIGRAIAGVSRELAALGPVPFAPSVNARVEHPHVRIAARSHAGALYVFAVNAGYTPVQAKLRVPGLGSRPVNVLGEGRRFGARDGSFTDSFAPLGVHLYVVEPADA